MDKNASSAGASISSFIVILMVLWFGAASYGFAWLLNTQFDTPQLRSATAIALAWPFVVLVVALPAILFVGSNFRHLLSLKKTIDDAPRKLSEALDAADLLRQNIEETGGNITNNINGALGEIEARLTAFEGRMQRYELHEQGQAPQVPQALSPRERLAAHLETASQVFYESLEVSNSEQTERGKQLIVTRGGGNRSRLVEELKRRKAFDRINERLNDAIAVYLKTVFEKQLSARRGSVDDQDVDNLDRMKQEAVNCGASFE
ncbi:MAG: hypothetical protein SFW09_23535 [Hyphomicrobiaceae bacterium]|nr:hypothetical protein [Hyphomicrobiaceae bacterium]